MAFREYQKQDNPVWVIDDFVDLISLEVNTGLCLVMILIAPGGSKYRAWNGRKQNFNMDKLEKKYEYIYAKINDYLDNLIKPTRKMAIKI